METAGRLRTPAFFGLAGSRRLPTADRSNGGIRPGSLGWGGLAYLADVYILPEARGQGLGKELVATMIDRGSGAGFRWMLHTADAHRLYEPFGFRPADATFLERSRPG